jgi:hypothetical protein
MLSTFIAAVVPLLSVLLGAVLTLWINVRVRRSNRIEDLFDEAIAATAVADASQNYLRSIGRPDGLSDQDYKQIIIDLGRTGIENHVKHASEAREALARVVQYEPGVRSYYQDSVIAGDRPQEIIRLLAEAKSRYVKTSRRK